MGLVYVFVSCHGMSSDGVGALFLDCVHEEHITPLLGYAGISGPVIVFGLRDGIRYITA